VPLLTFDVESPPRAPARVAAASPAALEAAFTDVAVAEIAASAARTIWAVAPLPLPPSGIAER
jgi:hypothetical protein